MNPLSPMNCVYHILRASWRAVSEWGLGDLGECVEEDGLVNGHEVEGVFRVYESVPDFRTQSKVVAQLTLLVVITDLHRSCSVAASLKTARPSPRRLQVCAGLSFSR